MIPAAVRVLFLVNFIVGRGIPGMHADAMLMGNVQQLTQQVTPTVHRDDVVAEGRLAAKFPSHLPVCIGRPRLSRRLPALIRATSIRRGSPWSSPASKQTVLLVQTVVAYIQTQINRDHRQVQHIKEQDIPLEISLPVMPNT